MHKQFTTYVDDVGRIAKLTSRYLNIAWAVFKIGPVRFRTDTTIRQISGYRPDSREGQRGRDQHTDSTHTVTHAKTTHTFRTNGLGNNLLLLKVNN